jgi:hypothetical protein
MSIASLFSVLERSHKRRFTYSNLLRDAQWQTLTETCLGDLQRSTSDILILTGAMRDLERLRIETSELIEALRLATNAEAAASKEKKTNLKSQKRHKAANKHAFPTEYRQVPFLVAHNFMLQQGAALKYLIQAETNEIGSAASNSGSSVKAAKAFWGNFENIEGFSKAIAHYRDALNAHQCRIYTCSLNDRCELPGVLNDLIRWVGQDMSDLLHVQSAVSLLLKNKSCKSDPLKLSALRSLALDAGNLTREVAASYLASLASLLTINGVALNPNVDAVLARAASTPLQGRIHEGKRTDVRRLARLPKGMFVRIEGVLVSAEFVERGNKSYFSAELRDRKGKDMVRVIASSNLLAHGLGIGSYVKVSGIYRKSGSQLYRGRHLEVERLKIPDVYSRDIWNIAFLNLSLPYFYRWPADLHVEFQPVPTNTTSNPPTNDAETTEDDCFDLHENFNDAVLLANIIGRQIADAQWAGPSIKAYLRSHCLDFPDGGGSTVPDCAAAINQAHSYLDATNPALVNYFNALMTAAKARQALSNCLWPYDPPETDPEEEIPDWVWWGDFPGDESESSV